MGWQRMCRWVFEKQSCLRTFRGALAASHDTASPLAGSPHETGNRDLQQETLGNVILAQLLLELPRHRQAFTSAIQDKDYEQLGLCTHKLAGAVAYCELPELSAALDALRQTLKTDNEEQIRYACTMANRYMTALMESSGIKPS